MYSIIHYHHGIFPCSFRYLLNQVSSLAYWECESIYKNKNNLTNCVVKLQTTFWYTQVYPLCKHGLNYREKICKIYYI